MNNKIKIICPEHGLFEQTAWQHLRMKQGCSACSGNRRLTKEKLEDMFVSKFGSDLVDFSNIRDIKNNSEKLEFICKKCKKVFYKSSQKLLARGGHYCNYFSKGEVLIENILRNNSKEYIKQYSFDDCTNNLEGRLNRKLLFDFFIPDKNVLIEFQGEQHFTPIKKFGGFDDFLIRIKNDSIKREYAFNKKIEILYINFWEIEKIEKILRDKELI